MTYDYWCNRLNRFEWGFARRYCGGFKAKRGVWNV